MAIEQVEHILGGPNRESVHIDLATVVSGGSYAAGDAVAEITVKDLGLPHRNLMLQENGGMHEMRWWQLDNNGWEYPEPEHIDVNEREIVLFGLVRARREPSHENRIAAGRSTEWLPFENKDTLFGMGIVRGKVEIMAGNVDATVSYYTSNAPSRPDANMHPSANKLSNALGIDETFLQTLSPEQADQYIRTVHRKLSMLFHPDVSGQDRERIQDINEDNERLRKSYGVSPQPN